MVMCGGAGAPPRREGAQSGWDFLIHAIPFSVIVIWLYSFHPGDIFVVLYSTLSSGAYFIVVRGITNLWADLSLKRLSTPSNLLTLRQLNEGSDLTMKVC
jgi:hypothetical protein